MKILLALLLLGFSIVTAAEPVLVGHWKLDDKDGETVVDSSPAKNHGKAVGSPGRVAGKNGGAFSFDGKTQYVEIPNSPQLERIQQSSYSMAAWFKADNVPPGAADEANDAQYGIILRTGFHEGLTYTREKKFLFTHWLAAEPNPTWAGIGAWDTEYDAGQWHHVVGVVDKDSNVAKIYVDGELKGTTEAWDAKANGRDYEQITWKIGVGNPGSAGYAWNAKGAIQDVRMYAGALSDVNVKALYDATAAGKDK